MDTQDWRLLEVLEKTGSMAKAAEILYVSQPALTRRIQQLEKEFQTKLLLRTSKGVLFTPEGTRLTHYAKQMHSEYQHAKLELASPETVKGRIRIAASASQTQFFLPKLLSSFREEYGDVKFDVVSHYSSQCLKRTAERTSDVAFFRGEHDTRLCVEKLIMHGAFAVYSRPFSIEELPQLPYINVEVDHSGLSIREGWWYDHFTEPPYTVMTVGNTNICMEMVRNGLGYGIFLNTDLFKEDTAVSALRLYYRDGTAVVRNDYLAYREEILEIETLRAFIDFAKDFAAKRQAEEDQASAQQPPASR